MLRFILPALLAFGLSASAGAASASLSQQVADAALDAQTRCYRLIHHNTFAFETCIKALLADEKKPGPRRLGIEYFGFVGAMNSSRLGMLGAQNTAWAFLQRFRASQKKLRIDDATLCATIPGDCEVRIARMKLIEKSPRPAPLDGGIGGEGHAHAH